MSHWLLWLRADNNTSDHVYDFVGASWNLRGELRGLEGSVSEAWSEYRILLYLAVGIGGGNRRPKSI